MFSSSPADNQCLITHFVFQPTCIVLCKVRRSHWMYNFVYKFIVQKFTYTIASTLISLISLGAVPVGILLWLTEINHIITIMAFKKQRRNFRLFIHVVSLSSPVWRWPWTTSNIKPCICLLRQSLNRIFIRNNPVTSISSHMIPFFAAIRHWLTKKRRHSKFLPFLCWSHAPNLLLHFSCTRWESTIDWFQENSMDRHITRLSLIWVLYFCTWRIIDLANNYSYWGWEKRFLPKIWKRCR